jgi:protein-disulfide isomerase
MVLIAGNAWSASSPGQADQRVAAEVDRDVITVETLDQALGPRRYKSEAQRYTFQRQKLDELINDKLLQQEAARRGVSVERLKETEVKARVRVTPEEVETFYRERKGSIPASESAAKDGLKRYLEQEREQEITRQLLERLRANAQVKIHLARPAAMAVEPLVVPGAPVKGPRQAAVTIVEFSDFQCPFCANAQAVLRQVLETYPGDVKLVYRHFPLERHSQAKLAAEAAECAAQQGKFWEYHDQLFASAAELTRTRLQSLAETVGLEPQGFSTCLESGASAARVAEDLAAGKKAGVVGTPTFFVNGRMLEGAQPFAAFKKIVDLYLVLSGPRSSARR